MSLEDLKKQVEELTIVIKNLQNPEKKETITDNKKYMVEWYKKNKVKHLDKLKNKSECECGEMVSYGNRIRHKTTSKHIKKLNTNKA